MKKTKRKIFIIISLHLFFTDFTFGVTTTYPTEFQEDNNFLLGIDELKRRNFDQALHHFLQIEDQNLPLPYIGQCYFEIGEMEKAKHFFPSDSLYMARITIREGRFAEAEKILTLDFQPFEESYFEQNYLRGELYFKQNLFEKAAEYFKKALPGPKAAWYSDTLYYLGWTEFKLNNLARAKNCFEELLQNCPSEEALCALFQCSEALDLPENVPHFKSDLTGWLVRALKEFKCKQYGPCQKSLSQAFELKNTPDILHWKGIVALAQQSNSELELIKYQLDKHTDLPNAEDIYTLIGLISAKLMQSENSTRFAEIGINALSSVKQTDQTLHLIGVIYYNSARFQEALTYFSSLIERFPDSPLAGEALFWSARCQNDSKEILAKVIEKYPDSKYAPDAYFHLHPHQDFVKKYPNHPLTLNALYLLGLDYLRDQKSPEGKWIRRKNYHEAITYFEKLEKAYEKIKTNTPLYHQALFEKGSAYLKIGNESTGTKKQIFFQYAADTYRRLLQEPIKPALREESSYWLAKTLSTAGDHLAAGTVLNQLILDFQEPQSYFLSKSWFEQGVIATRQSNYTLALNDFIRAEQSALSLSSDERLEILIEQSQCYKMLNNLDSAMLTLSKAINDDAISGLRLKAMFLRAEIYEKQGRLELARKQLEATAKKGGEWGSKAIAKLEKEYGYK